jgi:hypothetical protein
LTKAGGRTALIEGGASHYGPQVAKVFGGLLLNRSPTNLFHDAPGHLRDVDLSSCYPTILSNMDINWGTPVVFEPGARSMTVKRAVDLLRSESSPNSWYIPVTGDLPDVCNTLIPSQLDAITGDNFTRKHRRARKDEVVNRPAAMTLRRIEAGVITSATWAMIQDLPKHYRTAYENLRAESVVFYPNALVARNVHEYDEMIAQAKTKRLPWRSTYSSKEKTITTLVELYRPENISLRFPISDLMNKLVDQRAAAATAHGHDSALAQRFKLNDRARFGSKIGHAACW